MSPRIDSFLTGENIREECLEKKPLDFFHPGVCPLSMQVVFFELGFFIVFQSSVSLELLPLELKEELNQVYGF